MEKDKKLNANTKRMRGESGSVEEIGFGLDQKDKKRRKRGGGGRGRGVRRAQVGS